MCRSCLGSGISRRAFLQTGAAALATTPLINIAEAQPISAADTPDAALKLLIDGNERYVANQPRERDFSSGRASRASGQAPFAAILGCADSRIAPELAFDQSPGDLFVVRVAGNGVAETITVPCSRPTASAAPASRAWSMCSATARAPSTKACPTSSSTGPAG